MAVPAARVTLFSADLRFFRETRTANTGLYAFSFVPNGTFRLGVAARGREYVEAALAIAASSAEQDVSLTPETHPGQWTRSGDIAPELLEGTGSAVLLPSGEALFCHDTIDPVCIDPVSGMKWYPPTSTTPQGCHIVTPMADGRPYYAGGSMTGNPQTQVVQVSEIYDRTLNSWTRKADLQTGRWYPGVVRLPDERLLILGGEGPQEGINRVNTCELYDPVTNSYTFTGSFARPQEIPPALLLLDGRVFKTWRDVEFYSIANGTWSGGPAMLQERVGRSNGDHCDHEAVYLPDGRVMTVGIRPEGTNTSPRMIEFYDPAGNAWNFGTNPRHIRMRPEVCMLPDGRVFCFGGEYTGPTNAAPVLKPAGQVQKCTNVTDLFDPVTNSWRAVADAARWVHYHDVTLLLPDGRVMSTGGAGAGAIFGDDRSIEYFSPPYLFRGVRPRIDSVSLEYLTVGANFTLRVLHTNSPTAVVLAGTRAATHWVDGGVQRYLSLPFTQNGDELTATVPNDPAVALVGWYLLYVMVDDIPSAARLVRITPVAVAPLARPTVSLAITDANASEPSATASFRLTRTGVTTAPLTVHYDLSGSAVNGNDYTTLPRYAVIPAGQTAANINLAPLPDSAAEGTETVALNLSPVAAYDVSSAASSGEITITDDDAQPPSAVLAATPQPDGSIRFNLTGPATAVWNLETSIDLQTWTAQTRIITDSTGVSSIDEVPAQQRLFIRALPAP